MSFFKKLSKEFEGLTGQDTKKEAIKQSTKERSVQGGRKISRAEALSEKNPCF
jgi:hypothetical protein